MKLLKKKHNLPLLTLEEQYRGEATTHREMINLERSWGNKTWLKERHFKKMLTKHANRASNLRYGVRESQRLNEALDERDYQGY